MQLAKNKARDDQGPADESGFSDFYDPAVNQYAGIKQQCTGAGRLQPALPAHNAFADYIQDFARTHTEDSHAHECASHRSDRRTELPQGLA